MPLGTTVTDITKNLKNLRNNLEANHLLIATGEITKIGTIVMTFEKPAGGGNTYVWFGYNPLEIYNHTPGQVSVSMDADTINMMDTSQQ